MSETHPSSRSPADETPDTPRPAQQAAEEREPAPRGRSGPVSPVSPPRTEVPAPSARREQPGDESSSRVVVLAARPGLLYQELRRAIFLVAGLYLVYGLAGPITAILLLFLLVFILAAVLNPVVAWLERWRVPRMLSAVVLVLLLMGLAVALGWLAVPPLLTELDRLVRQLDQERVHVVAWYQELLRRNPELEDLLPQPTEILRYLSVNLATLLGQVGRYTVDLAVSVMGLLLLLVLLIYTVGNPGPLVAGLLAATPEQHRARVDAALRRTMEQLKNWAFGSAIVGAIVGVITGVGLHLMGVPYALLFGVIAAVGELIVTLGPILAAIPPLLLSLTISPQLALGVALFFVVVQQLESHVISPMVYGKRLELHPVSLIFTILLMHTRFGLLGALLAVPVCAIVKVCWEEFYLKPRQVDTEAMEAAASALLANGMREAREPVDAGRRPP